MLVRAMIRFRSDRYVLATGDRRRRPKKKSLKRWYQCVCGRWWGKNKHFRCTCGELPPSFERSAIQQERARISDVLGSFKP